MRILKHVSVSLLLLVVLASVADSQPVLGPEARKQIDDAVEGAIARRATPSACVVIGTADSILYAKAYGRLTYDETSPAATLDTLYDLASVSKAVGTTTAAMLLIQDGKLSLDDPVSKYLPDWDREDKRAIKVGDLISHMSGLPSYTNAGKCEEERKPGESKADALIRRIASLPLEYKTQEGWRYACLNFLTLARVNETASGISQESFLRRRVWVPLGMLHTGYYLSEAKKSQAAPTVGGEHFRQGIVHDPLANYYESQGYRCSGNAGLFSSANDLAKFCQMILNGGKWQDRRVFAPQTIDMFSTNRVPEKVGERFAAGWGLPRSFPYATSLNEGSDKACFSHSGYTGTYIHFDRLAGTFVIVLTNRVFPDDKASTGAVLRAVLRTVVESDPLYKGVQPPRQTAR